MELGEQYPEVRDKQPHKWDAYKRRLTYEYRVDCKKKNIIENGRFKAVPDEDEQKKIRSDYSTWLREKLVSVKQIEENQTDPEPNSDTELITDEQKLSISLKRIPVMMKPSAHGQEEWMQVQTQQVPHQKRGRQKRHMILLRLDFFEKKIEKKTSSKKRKIEEGSSCRST